MKIDTHIHLYDPATELSWPQPGTQLYRKVSASDFLIVGEKHNFSKAVVVECATEIENNMHMLETSQEEEAVLAVIAYIDMKSPEFTQIYDRYSQFSKFRGLRYRYNSSDGCTDDVRKNIAYLSGKRANIIELHGSYQELIQLSELVLENPDVQFIIEHVGCIVIDGKEVPEVYINFLKRMSLFDNVCMKLSAIICLSKEVPAPTELSYYLPVLEANWNVFGDERLIFGSDWPVLELKGTYDEAVGLTEEYLRSKSLDSMDKVMYRNAMRIYS